jgi:hypothetical protein
VQLPRLYLAWLTPAITPRRCAARRDLRERARRQQELPAVAELYDLQVAQNVVAYQNSEHAGLHVQDRITARPSKEPPAQVLENSRRLSMRN